MRILVINGSPRKNGMVAKLLRAVCEGLAEEYQTDFVNAYDLRIQPCNACMVCRDKGECILPEDDAHRVGRLIREADGLLIGTPTYWGNMSAQLKMLLERNVPVFMGESARGMPLPRQKGKKAGIVTACTTPYPFNFIFPESRGAIRAVREVLHYGGYQMLGTVVQPGSRYLKEPSPAVLKKAKALGEKFSA